jgi:hypothetical protein
MANKARREDLNIMVNLLWMDGWMDGRKECSSVVFGNYETMTAIGNRTMIAEERGKHRKGLAIVGVDRMKDVVKDMMIGSDQSISLIHMIDWNRQVANYT